MLWLTQPVHHLLTTTNCPQNDFTHGFLAIRRCLYAVVDKTLPVKHRGTLVRSCNQWIIVLKPRPDVPRPCHDFFGSRC